MKFTRVASTKATIYSLIGGLLTANIVYIIIMYCIYLSQINTSVCLSVVTERRNVIHI